MYTVNPENYLQKVMTDGASDFIDERDAENLFQYLHGHCKWLSKPRRIFVGNSQPENTVTTVSFENFATCLQERSRMGIDLLSKVVHCLVHKMRISEAEAKKRVETILQLSKQVNYDGLALQRLATRAAKLRPVFEKLLWQKMITSSPGSTSDMSASTSAPLEPLVTQSRRSDWPVSCRTRSSSRSRRTARPCVCV